MRTYTSIPIRSFYEKEQLESLLYCLIQNHILLASDIAPSLNRHQVQTEYLFGRGRAEHIYHVLVLQFPVALAIVLLGWTIVLY